MLTATGIVSAATVRYAIDGTGDDLVLAYGFVLYLVLILISVPRRTVPFAPLIAFACFAGVYLSSTVGEGTNDLGMALYVSAGALAYIATQRVFRPLTVAAFALWTPAFRLFGPDPFGGFYPGWVATAAILALFFLVLMLLARDAADPDEQLRRIGLGLLGVACVAHISERHFVVANPGGIAPDDLWSLVVVAVFPVLAVAKLRRPTRDALATGVALGAYVLVGIALITGKSYHVDSVSVVHRAAELFLQGRDPYRDLDITEALLHFGLDPRLATHLIDGSPLHNFNYPALSFLVPAPFIALGLQDIRYIYLVEVVVLVLVLIRQAAVPWRPLVTAAVVGNAVISRQNILAGVDPLWAVLIACAFLAIAWRWTSAILLGLAVATRQPAWYFVPFYLLAVWKRHGRGEALRRTAIAAVVAILPNLPFFIAAPLDFLGGVGAPMLGDLEPYGVGLIRFATDGLVPFLPRGAYAALSLIALTVLAVILWRVWRRYPAGALVFPSIVLWFGWRSLQNYFSFAGIFAMVGDEQVMAAEPAEPPEPV
ncbi:MAG TPA: hypothetical protein VHG53_01625 [Candidatus Limnocylindria bacterium]|nr:hypothetical protein [Candidatus Limnocylindria bacterium]